MSNRQDGLELNKYVLDLSSKIAFMLITASTASIAYVLTQVKDEPWSTMIYFPIYSLTLLAISFMCGYKHLSYRTNLTYANSMLLQITNNPTMSKKQNDLVGDMEKYAPKVSLYSRLQYLTFLFGAAVYAIYIFLSIFIDTQN
ncbi:hypothetical protein [Acinetobacter chinensis]|uniref:hypothetical protein n=1 Tax=Acinetobacter chinensis TaxID=2004650 RepID=UPI0029348DCC|nr:hypothetical protein [Acinetobacter chinensis]WOE40678.1 hypothetical protein QSG87_12395 [Acinetobacter chinensis]